MDQESRIAWNKVTWYSKLLAAVLFIALPFLGFWAGVRYEQTLGPLHIVVDTGGAGTPSSTPDEPNDPSLSAYEPPTTLTARVVSPVKADLTFSFIALPNVSFRITNISRAQGTVPVLSCGGGAYVFLPNAETAGGGTCVAENKLRPGGGRFGLAVVELEIDNRSNAYVNSRFLQLFYNPETGDDIDSKLAVTEPAQDAYGALPQSKRRITVSFLIPENQEQVQLVYGDYGKAPGRIESTEIMLGKSVGGWIVNFKDKTAVTIPG